MAQTMWIPGIGNVTTFDGALVPPGGHIVNGGGSNPSALPGFYSPSNNKTVNASNSAYDPNSGAKPQQGSTYNGWTYGSDGAWHGDSNSVGAAPMVGGGTGYTAPAINQAGLAQIAAIQKQQKIQEGTNKINSMYGDAQSAQLEAIRRARDTAQSGLGAYERTAVQQAYKNRNQADAAAAKNALRLKEIMASNGLLSSGDNLTANIQQNNERLSALNDINQTETDTLQSIADQRQNIANSAASQETELAKQISADKAKAIMAMEQYQDQRALEMDRDAYNRYRDGVNDEWRKSEATARDKVNNAIYKGEWDGSKTVQQKAADAAEARADAGLTGEYNKYAPDIAQMQLRTRDWWNASPEDRVKLAALNREQGARIGAYQDSKGDWVYPQATKTLQARQLDSGEQWKQKEWDWNTSPYNPDNIYKKASADNIGVSNQIARERLAWDKDPNNPDNIYKSASAANVGKSSSGSSSSSTKFTPDSNYYDDVAEIRKTPHIAVATIEGNREALINYYGTQGYAALLKEAQTIQNQWQKEQDKKNQNK